MARAFLDLSYEFTFHGAAGLGGRYQRCLTQEHGWYWDGTPITNVSFESVSGGPGSGGPHGWSSNSCEGSFSPA